MGGERWDRGPTVADSKPELSRALLQGIQQMGLSGMREASREAAANENTQDLIGIDAQALGLDRLDGLIAELDLTPSRVIASHPEGRVLDLDLAAEAADLDDEDSLPFGEADPPQEGGVELGVADQHALVNEPAIPAKHESRGAKGRRAAQSASGSTLPSLDSRSAPRKS